MKSLALGALLCAFFMGCRQSPATPTPGTDVDTESTGRAAMGQFKIGGTDFGIDTSTSSVTVDTTDPNRPTITIELSGDQAIFADLSADEDSEWSWALYPPGFYLRSFPAQVDPTTGIVTARVKRDDIDNYEFAIYMMEHSDIDDVVVQLMPGKSLKIAGRVDLFGEVDDFAIQLEL